VKRAWLLLPAAALFALLAWGFGRQSSRAADRAQAGDSAELRELRAETERLREAVAALEKAQREQRQAPASLPPEVLARLNAAAAQRPADPPPKLTEAQEREDSLRYARYLDDELIRSPEDDAEAAALKAKSAKFFDQSSTLLEVQCGKQLCRMKTRHKDGEAYRVFQNGAFKLDERLWTGPITFVVIEEPDENGRPLVASIYLGRGDALPSPEPAR
jgi:hypothetical protein